MPAGHTRHGKVWAGRAHRVTLTISVDVADLIEVAVDEQHRLRQLGALRA